MQTGCFKLGKHFKLPSFMKYVYLLIHVFFHLFSHLLACNLSFRSFIGNEILLHVLLFCHLVCL